MNELVRQRERERARERERERVNKIGRDRERRSDIQGVRASILLSSHPHLPTHLCTPKRDS